MQREKASKKMSLNLILIYLMNLKPGYQETNINTIQKKGKDKKTFHDIMLCSLLLPPPLWRFIFC
jgi:hypothetical protein